MSNQQQSYFSTNLFLLYRAGLMSLSSSIKVGFRIKTNQSVAATDLFPFANQCPC